MNKEFWDINVYYSNSGIIEKGVYSFNKLYKKTICKSKKNLSFW
jgi:hypothetical protein